MSEFKGKVSWFNSAKGYGFLACENHADVFVHYSSITVQGYKTLKEDDEVEFDIIEGSKGPQADHVVITNRSDTPVANVVPLAT